MFMGVQLWFPRTAWPRISTIGATAAIASHWLAMASASSGVSVFWLPDPQLMPPLEAAQIESAGCSLPWWTLSS